MRLLVIFLFLFFIIKISPLYEKIERIKRFKLKNFIPKKEFVIGIAIGYGVNTQASDEIKQCFHQREEKNSHLIENFFKNINLTKKISKEQSKDKLEVGTIGFIKSARELFFEIKNCPPLRQSILSLVANKIMNLAVKGVIYMATGMTGVLIKTGYDLYKLVNEIYAFYNGLKEKKRDYMKLGTNIGKILYYSQNIILRRRRRFRRLKKFL